MQPELFPPPGLTKSAVGVETTLWETNPAVVASGGVGIVDVFVWGDDALDIGVGCMFGLVLM